jgi:DNA-binding transcriptional ArsR family regulator
MQVTAQLTHPQVATTLAERFRLLSEPSRLRLIGLLGGGRRCVGELATELGCSQANASKHLGLLADAGLLERRRVGLNCYYSISDPAVFALCDAAWASLCRQVDARAAAVRGIAAEVAADEPAAYMRSRSASTSST